MSIFSKILLERIRRDHTTRGEAGSAHKWSRKAMVRGVQTRGEAHAPSGFAKDGEHWLSVRRRKAKAQKSLPFALRCAVHAPRKPWVAVLGHPSNACVRPRDGLTAARNMTSRDHPINTP
jgi:hypothetical protein